MTTVSCVVGSTALQTVECRPSCSMACSLYSSIVLGGHALVDAAACPAETSPGCISASNPDARRFLSASYESPKVRAMNVSTSCDSAALLR